MKLIHEVLKLYPFFCQKNLVSMRIIGLLRPEVLTCDPVEDVLSFRNIIFEAFIVRVQENVDRPFYLLQLLQVVISVCYYFARVSPLLNLLKLVLIDLEVGGLLVDENKKITLVLSSFRVAILWEIEK